MLVPLLNPVLVLLEPVTAALILEPGACVCTHAWQWFEAGGAGEGGRHRDAARAGRQRSGGLWVASMCNICMRVAGAVRDVGEKGTCTWTQAP